MLTLAGCTSGADGRPVPGPPPAPPSTIAEALEAVPVTSWDTTYAEFGDIATVVALNGGKPGSGPLTTYVGVGESDFADELPEGGGEGESEGPLGFDPFDVSSALEVGNEPHQITMVYRRSDAASIGVKLAKEGFKQHGRADGGDLWSVGDDDQPSPSNPTGVPNLNVMLVSVNWIALGGASADAETIAAVAPQGKGLSSSGAMGAVAACLGAAVAAVIGPRAPSATDPPLLGIGLLAGSRTDGSEELCVEVSGAAQAADMAATWTAQIKTGHSTRLDAPWSTLLTDPHATTLPAVNDVVTVRLTAKPAPGARIGVLLEDYYAASSDIDKLLGQS